MVKNGQLWGGRGGDASNSEHLPVFRAPREGDWRMHQSMDKGSMHQSTDAKSRMRETPNLLTDVYKSTATN